MKGFVVWGWPASSSGGELDKSLSIAAIFVLAILIVVILTGS